MGIAECPAHSEALLEELGAEHPSQLAILALNLWPAPPKRPPEWSQLKIEIEKTVNKRLAPVSSLSRRRVVSTLISGIQWKRELTPGDFVERLLAHDLKLNRQEYHRLGEKLPSVYERFKEALFAIKT